MRECLHGGKTLPSRKAGGHRERDSCSDAGQVCSGSLFGVPVVDGHFPTLRALNWPVKRMHIAADKSHSSQCLVV